MKLMAHILYILIRNINTLACEAHGFILCILMRNINNLACEAPVFYSLEWENADNLACEARGLYSSEPNKKMLTIQPVSLMACILSQQSGLWGSRMQFL